MRKHDDEKRKRPRAKPIAQIEIIRLRRARPEGAVMGERPEFIEPGPGHRVVK